MAATQTKAERKRQLHKPTPTMWHCALLFKSNTNCKTLWSARTATAAMSTSVFHPLSPYVNRVRVYLAMIYAEGGCYCGKVKFKAALPALWAGHCHCTQCQRLHGAAFVTWVGFKTAAEVIDPEKQFKTFSTGIAEQGYCQNCGSTFYFRYTKERERGGQEWLEVTYFARANFLNDPG